MNIKEINVKDLVIAGIISLAGLYVLIHLWKSIA